MNLRQRISKLPVDVFIDGNAVSFKKISSDEDLATALFDMTLNPDQQELVNPASFSIGRAYLSPDNNIPYLIYANEGDKEIPVGFIVLRSVCCNENLPSLNGCVSSTCRTNWSYFITTEHQSKGYGKKAAELAIKILTAAAPECQIQLTAEQKNEKAIKLYTALGFKKADYLDGDDYVFLYQSQSEGKPDYSQKS